MLRSEAIDLLEDLRCARPRVTDFESRLFGVGRSRSGPSFNLHRAAQFAPYEDNFAADFKVIPNRTAANQPLASCLRFEGGQEGMTIVINAIEVLPNLPPPLQPL